jgi:hypothetical protein
MKRGITEDLERFGIFWKNKNWSRGELLLEEVKTFLALRRSKELLVFLQEIGKRFSDFREVLNEAAAVTCQTEEASDFLDILRRKPFNNCLDSFRIDNNAFSRNNMPEISNLRRL